MNGFLFEYLPNICEQPGIFFESTGSQGGDAGHGGRATLTFTMEGGDGFGVLVQGDQKTTYQQAIKKVSITVFGDWELAGMAVALLELGRSLLNRDDVLIDRAMWRDNLLPVDPGQFGDEVVSE